MAMLVIASKALSGHKSCLTRGIIQRLLISLLTCTIVNAEISVPLRVTPGAYNPSLVAYKGQFILVARITAPSRPGRTNNGINVGIVENAALMCVARSLTAVFNCSQWDPWGSFVECRFVHLCILMLLAAVRDVVSVVQALGNATATATAQDWA